MNQDQKSTHAEEYESKIIGRKAAAREAGGGLLGVPVGHTEKSQPPKRDPLKD